MHIIIYYTNICVCIVNCLCVVYKLCANILYFSYHHIILSSQVSCIDFDGTCTEHDTTPLLPRLAAFFATRQRSSIAPESDDIHKQDLERRLLQFKQLINK